MLATWHFPRLNLASWYIYMTGAAMILWVIFSGGIDTGWTFYTPFSSKASHTDVIPAMIAIAVAGFSSIFTGLNFIVTVHYLRAPGMTWFRLPLFVWSLYATSIILLLATPVLTIALLLVAFERIFGIGIFDPALGGDPLLFQHLFWFYSHPAVYIMILPGMGIVSEIITCFSRKNIFGYKFVVLASMGIAVLGFLVWAHHMFVAGQSVYASLVFSLLSYCVAIPSAIKVFNWTATLYRGSITYHTPMLYALGFIGLFTLGGLTGLFLAALGLNVHVHDTYFVIAHFHFIMVGGMVMAYMGGLHFWWPKITGRLYPGKLGAAFRNDDLCRLPAHVSAAVCARLSWACRAATMLIRPNFKFSMCCRPPGLQSSRLAMRLPLTYLIWSLRYGPRPARIPGMRPASNGKHRRRRPHTISPRFPSSTAVRTSIRARRFLEHGQ